MESVSPLESFVGVDLKRRPALAERDLELLALVQHAQQLAHGLGRQDDRPRILGRHLQLLGDQG
jgi:hypothetical protein